ncbi:hypothetical protein CR513_36111, partial [Mucuna pruriens]
MTSMSILDPSTGMLVLSEFEHGCAQPSISMVIGICFEVSCSNLYNDSIECVGARKGRIHFKLYRNKSTLKKKIYDQSFYKDGNKHNYEKVYSCKSSKEMWDTLALAYKETSQVRDSKISMLVHQYELFKMEDRESIDQMFRRFQTIINNLRRDHLKNLVWMRSEKKTCLSLFQGIDK